VIYFTPLSVYQTIQRWRQDRWKKN